MSALYARIFAVVQTIPHGVIASYSQVARTIGMPRGARIVGWALRTLPEDTQVPWWRVINMKREVSIVNRSLSPERQRELLEKEGRILTWNGGMYVVSGDDWWQAPEPLLLPPLER